MNRAAVLYLAGASAVAFTGLSRCAQRQARFERYIVPLRLSSDAVVSAEIGARPFRASGFRLERIKAFGKTIVHNYGHGGAGVTLSWGTAEMAIGLVERDLAGGAAVLGAGVIGLTTALQLQQRGVSATIYTERIVEGTSSFLAPAQFFPSHAYDLCAISPTKSDDIIRATRISRDTYAHIYRKGSVEGVRFADVFHLSDYRNGPLLDPVIAQMPWLYADFEQYPANGTPFPARLVYKFRTFAIDMPRYLASMQAAFLKRGGTIRRTTIRKPQQLASFPEPVVFNCLGSGASRVFDDETVKPLSSWMVIVRKPPDFDYMVVNDECAIVPRKECAVLIGPRILGSKTAVASQSTVTAVAEAAQRIFGKMPAKGQLNLGIGSNVLTQAEHVGSC